MNTFVFLLLFVGQNFNRISLTSAEFCPFEQTVNLTNHKRYENGSYFYQATIIPLTKQQFYAYDVKFDGLNVSVPSHLRGCACDQKPCIKLCCAQDEYLEELEDTIECKKFPKDKKLLWNLLVQLKSGKELFLDARKYFILQEGLPCLEPEPLLAEDNAILLENGHLHYQGTELSLTTLDYCYSPAFDNETEKYILTPFTCAKKYEVSSKLIWNAYAMISSIIFLIPTIVVYLILKELRGNLRGKLLICYLLSLTIGYTILMFINISAIHFDHLFCCLLGFTCYFFSMAAFLWLSVLCFDIWKNFKETNVELNSRKNRKQFIIYSLYAWLTAGLATGLLVFIQFSPHIHPFFKPDIGTEWCWMDVSKWSAAIYFYGPNLIILLFNFVTFTNLTTRIYKVRKNLAKITHKEKFIQQNGIVILRLFLIMGVSWLFDILSYCLREHEEWKTVFMISDFCNASQGILIFILFVLKPNVLKLLKKKFCNRQNWRPRRSVSSINTHFSKLQTSTSVTSPATP